MNPTPPNERVSAYFDEELSASEIEDVTRLLKESESARRELSDIRQLSEDLRSLPREAASPAIFSGVMTQVSSGNSHAAARSRSWRISPWRNGKWIAIAAAAGALIAWIPTFWNQSDSMPPDSVVDSQNNPLPDIAETSEPVAPDAAVVANRDSHRRRVELGTEAELLAQARKQRPTGESPPSPAIPANTVEKDNGPVPSESNGQSLGTPSLAHNSLPANLADGLRKQLAADSDVRKILEHAQTEHRDERVAVVNVTNANSQLALRELQALFAKNAVPAASGNGSFGLAAEDKAEAAKDHSHMALYVEATPAQAAAVLSQLGAQNSGSKLESNKTVAWNEIPIIPGEERRLRPQEDVDRARQRPMKSLELDAQKAQATIAAGDAKKTNPDAKPATAEKAGASTEKKAGESKPKTSLQKGDFRRPGNSPDSLNPAVPPGSFQLLVELPRSEAAPNSPKTRDEFRSEAAELQQKRAKEEVASGAGSSSAKVEKSRTGSAVVRLLFIFHQTPAK